MGRLQTEYNLNIISIELKSVKYNKPRNLNNWNLCTCMQKLKLVEESGPNIPVGENYKSHHQKYFSSSFFQILCAMVYKVVPLKMNAVDGQVYVSS